MFRLGFVDRGSLTLLLLGVEARGTRGTALDVDVLPDELCTTRARLAAGAPAASKRHGDALGAMDKALAHIIRLESHQPTKHQHPPPYMHKDRLTDTQTRIHTLTNTYTQSSSHNGAQTLRHTSKLTQRHQLSERPTYTHRHRHTYTSTLWLMQKRRATET